MITFSFVDDALYEILLLSLINNIFFNLDKPPVCKLVFCGVAPKIDFAIRSDKSKLSYNETSEYKCQSGFETSDETTIRVSLNNEIKKV